MNIPGTKCTSCIPNSSSRGGAGTDGADNFLRYALKSAAVGTIPSIEKAERATSQSDPRDSFSFVALHRSAADNGSGAFPKHHSPSRHPFQNTAATTTRGFAVMAALSDGAVAKSKRGDQPS